MSASRKGGATSRRRGMSSVWRSNRGIAMMLLVLVLAIGLSIWQSDWAHRVLRDGFRLGGFPMIGVGLMVLCIGVLMFDRRARLIEPEVASVTLLSVVVVLGGLVLLLVIFQLYWLLGFAPSVTLFVAGVALALGFRPVWIALATGAGTALALSLIAYLLGVPLPHGPLLALVNG